MRRPRFSENMRSKSGNAPFALASDEEYDRVVTELRVTLSQRRVVHHLTEAQSAEVKSFVICLSPMISQQNSPCQDEMLHQPSATFIDSPWASFRSGPSHEGPDSHTSNINNMTHLPSVCKSALLII